MVVALMVCIALVAGDDDGVDEKFVKVLNDKVRGGVLVSICDFLIWF